MDVLERWTRHLRATDHQANTITSYRSDVTKFRKSLADGRLRTATADDVSQFLSAGAEAGLASATIMRRYRSLHRFYTWLSSKNEVEPNPVSGAVLPVMKTAVDVLSPTELAALLGACADENTHKRHGRTGPFEARRDTALVLLLITTGMTATEVVSLATTDVDRDARTIRIGRHPRRVRSTTLLNVAFDALEKYFLVRDQHPWAARTTALWLGTRGPLSRSGLSQMLIRRSDAAGVRPITASDFRRTFASDAMGRGVDAATLAALGGWGSARGLERFRPVERASTVAG